MNPSERAKFNDKALPESIIEIYSNLGAYEQHFNEIQSKYRSLASTWLLATFAGIGFILSEKLNMLIPLDLTIAAIAVAGSIGIYLLWNLDHMVYHRLLESAFIECLKLEDEYDWLPKAAHNMRTLQEGGKGVSSRILLFYLVPQFILYIIAIFSYIHWLNCSYLNIYSAVILLLVLSLIVVVKDMYTSTQKSINIINSLIKEK
jgi:hypothetical protein